MDVRTLSTDRVSPGFYFRTLTRILGEPRRFFRELPPETGLLSPLMFLMASSVLSAGGAMAGTENQPLITGGILFANAVGMVFIASGIGYLVLIPVAGRRVPYSRFFAVYAFSAGVTLLASWLPFFICLTEPWKWWLIGAGMIHSLGLTRTQALIIIGISIGVMILFFRSLLPLI